MTLSEGVARVRFGPMVGDATKVKITAVAIVAFFAASSPPASGQTLPRQTVEPCAALFSFSTECAVRPAKLGIGAKGAVKGISYSSWGVSPAVGRGTLTVAGFVGEKNSGIGPTKGKVIFRDLVTCSGVLQYATLTVKYGKKFKRKYVRSIPWAPC